MNETVVIEIVALSSQKCERCLRRTTDVETHRYWPSHKLCGRCVRVLLETGFPPYEYVKGELKVFESEQDYWRNHERTKLER